MTRSDEAILCSIVFKMARAHGWSSQVDVHRLVDNANVLDKQRGRKLARNELPKKVFIGYHQGKDTIWLKAPPGDELRQFLGDTCGYGKLQIQATFDSYEGRG